MLLAALAASGAFALWRLVLAPFVRSFLGLEESPLEADEGFSGPIEDAKIIQEIDAADTEAKCLEIVQQHQEILCGAECTHMDRALARVNASKSARRQIQEAYFVS